MFNRKTEAKAQEEYLFDFKNMSFVVERILEKYLLQGKLKKYNESFFVVSDKDQNGAELSYNLSLNKIGLLVQDQSCGEKSKGLKLNYFSDPFESLLMSSQWFSRFNNHSVEIVSERKTTYSLLLPCEKKNIKGEALVYNSPYLNEIFIGGAFQSDKILRNRVLISEVSSKRLDEIIRHIYQDRISEIG